MPSRQELLISDIKEGLDLELEYLERMFNINGSDEHKGRLENFKALLQQYLDNPHPESLIPSSSEPIYQSRNIRKLDRFVKTIPKAKLSGIIKGYIIKINDILIQNP